MESLGFDVSRSDLSIVMVNEVFNAIVGVGVFGFGLKWYYTTAANLTKKCSKPLIRHFAVKQMHLFGLVIVADKIAKSFEVIFVHELPISIVVK